MTTDKTNTVRRRHVVLGVSTYVIGLSNSEVSEAKQTKKSARDTDPVYSGSPWLNLPPTPNLPKSDINGLASVNGVTNFYAKFGKGPPVLFLHGGLANSNYWGLQVGKIAEHFTVIVMDTRGHGRSPLSSSEFSYRTFAGDVIELLGFLGIKRISIVGWSDGAITGIDLAINNPEFIKGVFAFGANSGVNGVKTGGSKTVVFSEFTARAQTEYQSLSPRPGGWPFLIAGLGAMWRSQPAFTSKQLSGIRIPVTISDGEHDEVIKREDTERLAREIPGAQLVIQPSVSHFAMIQKPDHFTQCVMEFLDSVKLN